MAGFISKIKHSGFFDFYPFNADATVRRTHAKKWYVLSIIAWLAASFDPLPDVIQFVALLLGGFASLVLGFLLY